MQLDKFIVVYKDGGLPEVWNTYTYQEVYRNNPDHFKGYRILTTFNENSAPFDTASIEQEAKRLYPAHRATKHIVDAERSAHITCARQYMGEIEKTKKESKIELLWELIEEWQDAQDNGEDINAPKFSFNDIEVALYEKMEQIDPSNQNKKL